MEIRKINNLHESLEILWEHDQKNQAINFPESQPNRELFEKNMQQSYTENPEGFFFVYNEDEIVGSLILRFRENPYRKKRYGEIWYIYLSPECRGQGYGSKLLQFADKFFQQNNCSYAFAGIAAHNPASKALFAKAGYETKRIILEKEYQ